MLNDFLCLIFHFSTSASSNNKISFCIFEYVRLDYVLQGKGVESPQVFPDGEATTHYLLIKSRNLNQISAVASELIKNGLLKAFSCLCYWFLCCLIARYSPSFASRAEVAGQNEPGILLKFPLASPLTSVLTGNQMTRIWRPQGHADVGQTIQGQAIMLVGNTCADTSEWTSILS